VLLGVDRSFGTIIPAEEIRNTLKEFIPQNVPYILCVAHSYPHKNIHLLVNAFGRLSNAIPHNLILVGKPRRGEKKLTDSIAGLHCKERLYRFTEGIPYKTVQMLYQGADIFVLPSAYEGFGLPVIEAMMAGVPVVTSREGSLPEVGDDCVFYLDALSSESITNTLRRVTNLNMEERRQCITKARQWSYGFTWQRSAEKLQAVLQHVVSAGYVTEKRNR
jgi:glycosyltransferase involved in cell wall biosynthesis